MTLAYANLVLSPDYRRPLLLLGLCLVGGACSTRSANQVRVPARPSSPAQSSTQTAPSAVVEAPADETSKSSQTEILTRNCKIEHAQEFDFWIGRWEVRTPDGKLAGYNHIRPILDGCTLKEDYRTANGKYRGTSLNRFDPATRAWHQVWVDNGGLWLSLAGGLQEGAMVMRGEYLQRRDPQGKLLPKPQATLQEIRWSKEPDQQVRQTWRSSLDGGQTWTLLFDGFYRRIEAIPVLPDGA